MSNFKSTLLSYHRYLDDGLFKNLLVPEGIDSQILIQIILKECGEMTPVWTDPVFMQDMIGVCHLRPAGRSQTHQKAC